MLDANQVSTFTGATINGVALSIADGKVNLTDIANFLRPIMTGNDAFVGVGEVGRQYYDATPEQRDQDDQLFVQEMTAVDEGRADLFARAKAGIFATWALATGEAEENAARQLAKYFSEPGAATDLDEAKILAIIRGK